MIRFRVEKNSKGKITHIDVSGHAGYADAGFDIVCAAVSTAVQMAVIGIETQKLADITYKTEDGFLSFDVPDERDGGADVLLNSLMIIICEIAKQYKRYLFILEV